MSRKHCNVEQLDGMTDTSELENDEKYENTEHYWKTGRLGTFYQFFIDANDVLDNCNKLNNEEKKNEKMKVLDARKRAFGASFSNFKALKVPILSYIVLYCPGSCRILVYYWIFITL